MLIDPKTWVFASLVCIANLGAHVANTFGPTLIRGFGFTPKNATLLNIPYGVMQAVFIFSGSYAAYRFKYRSIPLIILALLALAGGIMLYVANLSEQVNKPLALVGYYFGAALFGISPVVYSVSLIKVSTSSR